MRTEEVIVILIATKVSSTVGEFQSFQLSDSCPMLALYLPTGLRVEDTAADMLHSFLSEDAGKGTCPSSHRVKLCTIVG